MRRVELSVSVARDVASSSFCEVKRQLLTHEFEILVLSCAKCVTREITAQ